MIGLVILLTTFNLKAAEVAEILDVGALNGKVDPCTDFYQFACGTWLEKTQIPSDKRLVSRQITPMADATDVTLHKVLISYAHGDMNPPSTYARKLGDLYSSCVDYKAETQQALDSVKEEIKDIVSRSQNNFAALTADLHKMGVVDLFLFSSIQDLNDSTHVIGDLAQGGMTLSNPAYYLDNDKKSQETRTELQKYIEKILILFGYQKDFATQKAQVILKMETDLAKHSYSVEDQGDPLKVNHVIKTASLNSMTPRFDWKSYFSRLNFAGLDLNIEEPEFFNYLNVFLSSVSPEDLETYLVFHWLDNASTKIAGDYEQAHFDFWDSYLNGAKTMLPRWKHCTQSVSQKMGYALAEAYIQLFDHKAIKEKTESMIDQIKSAFVEDLKELNIKMGGWLDDVTIDKAMEKVGMMNRKVGAPEKFRNYDPVIISKNNYLQNVLNLTSFEFMRVLSKIDQPVDRSEWQMMPWEVNAYYDRSMNEFVFPYGILLPPSLDLQASDGANFGSFGGGTIGHELTHGFDNNGSKYDSQGNLKNWWSQTTVVEFQKKSQCYVDKATAYKIAAVNLHVNGAQTLEENLADQGGIKLGYLALDKILSQRAEGPLWNDKYNERQQFWIAYAQGWCTKYTNELLRMLITNDTHPPAEFRVNGVVVNRPEFAKDFKCPVGSPMAPANRCSLW